MLMISQICLAAIGMTLPSVTLDIKDSLMLSWVTSCIYTTPARSPVAGWAYSSHIMGWLRSCSRHNLWKHSQGQCGMTFGWVTCWLLMKKLFLTPKFGNPWIWYCRDISIWVAKIRWRWPTGKRCLRWMQPSSLVNEYRTSGFMHQMSTCRTSRGRNWMSFGVVQTLPW
jgi:hypothetical protein